MFGLKVNASPQTPIISNSPRDVVERNIMVVALHTDSPQEVKMNTMTIELPVEGLPSPADLPDNFSDEARYLLALKLFEQGRILSGKAGTPGRHGTRRIPACRQP